MHTVLLVDDDAPFRDTLAEVLGFEGYQVIQMKDGDADPQYIREHRPHLVVADMMMPGMTGLELLNVVREDDNLGDLPFILVSGRTDKHILREAQQTMASAVLYKPFEVQELLSLIKELIR